MYNQDQDQDKPTMEDSEVSLLDDLQRAIQTLEYLVGSFRARLEPVSIRSESIDKVPTLASQNRLHSQIASLEDLNSQLDRLLYEIRL